MKDKLTYSKEHTREISFPLGGIGAGCIGLGGNGALLDWEIFNRANKGSRNGLTHFAVRAEKDGKVLDTRILQGDYDRDYSGEKNPNRSFSGFGWGPMRENMCAMPHFRDHEFTGEFPLAEIRFGGEDFPGKPVLKAWSVHIPLNEKDSSLPAAFFEIEMENSTSGDLDYTFLACLSNPFGNDNCENRIISEKGLTQLTMTNKGRNKADFSYGDISLSTMGADVSHQTYLYRGGWCDSLQVYWDDLNRGGLLQDRTYPEGGGQGCWESRDSGVLAVHVKVKAGETGKANFVITWNVPNCTNHWDSKADELAKKNGVKNRWKNWYATQWSDSLVSGRYAMENRDNLYGETKIYHDTLYSSTLPEAAMESAGATQSVLKTPTVMRLEDGTFYGWEGIGMDWGSCEGSCTHVWNYAQAQAFQFPALERSMRSANYTYNVDEEGGSHFRIKLPLGIHGEKDFFRPCADGQFGDIMKTYRDWKLSGDDDWLTSLYPALKKTVEYAWSPENPDKWDPEKTGVLWGRQHHTLDMELFGPNPWLTGFYLGGLKAASLMAEHLGDADFAGECRELFEKGKAWVDENLFNGEYFVQKIDLHDKSVLEPYIDDLRRLDYRSSVMEEYWDGEHNQIKYQIQDGCFVNQVIAQWFADLYGLGEIFDPAKVKSTLKAIYKYNFMKSVRDLANPWRVYVLNDEGGTLDCVWPEGTEKPAIPLPYDTETQAGYEYGAVVHMISAGLEKEGLDGVKAIRDRFDGLKRNPWNEIECGNNYARSMASFALLNAYSGFEFDMGKGHMGFNPIVKERPFTCFWVTGTGWGTVVFGEDKADIKVLHGLLALNSLDLHCQVENIFLDNEMILFSREGTAVRFAGEKRTAGVYSLSFT